MQDLYERFQWLGGLENKLTNTRIIDNRTNIKKNCEFTIIMDHNKK